MPKSPPLDTGQRRPADANVGTGSRASHERLQSPNSSQAAATARPDQADNDLTEETYRQLQMDADLLDQLILTIRRSSPEDTRDLIALIRGVDSHEKLKTRLDQYRPPTRGAAKSGETTNQKPSPKTARKAERP